MKRTINIWANTDWITVALYLVLVFLGCLNIYASLYSEENQSILDFTQPYGKQIIWIFAALFVALIIFLVDSKFFPFFAYPIYVVIIFLLIAVFLFGTEIHGARSWFQIGGFNLQPAEFAKFATLLAIAKYLSSYNLKIHRLKTLFFLAVILLLPAILIFLQNDTGTALVFVVFIFILFREGLSASFLFITLLLVIFFILSLILDIFTIIILLMIVSLIFFWIYRKIFKEVRNALAIFIAISACLWWINEIFSLNFPLSIIVLTSLGISGILFFILAYAYKIPYVYIIFSILIASILYTYSVDYFFNNVLEQHQQARINVLLGIEQDLKGAGYNVNQSKIAIGSGGLTGKGFLQGTQTKFDFVPQQSTDFIFCTVGEEWGFFGTSVVIILFVFLLLRLIFLAERQRSKFSRIYGYGVVSILFFHFFINIGMTIGLTPVIGIPLPFLSYGGSSLWGFTILLFIFIRLDARRLELFR